MDNCTLDCIQIYGNFSLQASCDFVQQSCVQDTVQFIQTYYCYLDQSFVLLILMGVSYSAIIDSLTILSLPCFEQNHIRFFSSLCRIVYWKVEQQALAGVTFLAFANGAPDVMTAIVAGTSSSDSTVLIPFGSLYGAALFGMAFIFAVVISQSPSKTLNMKKRQSIIPLAFYIGGTVFLMMVSLFYGKMNIIIASVFLVLYVVYIGIVLYFERQQKKNNQNSILTNQSLVNVVEEPLTQKMDEVREALHKQQQQANKINQNHPIKFMIHYVDILCGFVFKYTVPPITKQHWSPKSAVVSLILSPFVMSMAYGFISSFQDTILNLPFVVWLHIPSIALLIHTIYIILTKKQLNGSVLYSLYAFAVIVCWIAHLCSALINFMELFSLLTHMNSVFLGLTILSWANSIGDYLSITTFAKKGFASTAIAGIFSGQLFNFLLGFGISLFYQSLDGQYIFNIFDIQGTTFNILSDGIIVAVIGLSLLYMIWQTVLILKNKGLFTNLHSKIAKYYYIFFVLAALALSTATDFFREVSCDI